MLKNARIGELTENYRIERIFRVVEVGLIGIRVVPWRPAQRKQTVRPGPHRPAPGATDLVSEVRLHPAPGSGLEHAFYSFNEEAHTTDILHCEIGSHIGSYSVVGGAIGSGLGTAAGIGAGIAVCIALGIFTFGIGAAVCALIVAALAAAGAAAGGLAGDAIGATIGWIVDELSDFDKAGKSIGPGTCAFVTGKWMTDTSHQHNEIHDAEGVQTFACGIKVVDPGLHPVGAVVGIGRQPAGTGNNLH